MAFIRKYYGPLILLLVVTMYLVFQFYQSSQFEKFYKHPQNGDIYIFKYEEKYSPYQLDFITQDSLYFFSHPYDFNKSVPEINQILENAFKNNIHYIYSCSELDRLLDEKKIIKIYR